MVGKSGNWALRLPEVTASARDVFGADVGQGAGLEFHDYRHAGQRAHVLRELPRQHDGATGGRGVGKNDAYRLAGKILLRHARQRGAGEHKAQGHAAKNASFFPIQGAGVANIQFHVRDSAVR